MDTSTQSDGKPREVGTKRKWSPEERETVVRASLNKGTTVSAVARVYGVNPSQIYEWRKQARQAAQHSKAATLIPVQVAESVSHDEAEAKPSCSVVIEAQSMRITVMGCMDAVVLRVLLECLAQ